MHRRESGELLKSRMAAISPATPSADGMFLEVPDRFSLRETVLSHGWYQLAPFRWEGTTSTLWRVESLPEGGAPIALRIRQPGGIGSRVSVRFHPMSVGESERRILRNRVVRMLGLKVDLSAFYQVCRRESRLRYVPRVGAGRFLSTGSLYEDVFKAICGTNISWKNAVRAVNRVAELGEPATGRALRAFPSPEKILTLGAGRLSAVSRLGYRVPYLLAWAGRACSKDAQAEAAEDGRLAEAELRKFLLSIPGIGPTSCRYLMMMRGMAGEIPVDSSALLFLKSTRFAGRTPSPGEILCLYKRFGPWRAYAYWFEFLPWARKHWALDDGESGLPV